jgi:hypothetical protein
MILSDYILPSRQNQIWNESGIDSKESCLDRTHFSAYPYAVKYRYNSRGFRDAEWPETIEELKKCIWCFGDSFTVGLGSPIDHTWVNILQNKLGVRCINVSMDGASNDWIARKAVQVIETIQPTNIVIHWSYLSRGELTDIRLSDEQRRLENPNVFLTDQFDNFKKNITLVEQYNNLSEIIYSFVPGASEILEIEDKWNQLKGADWPEFPKTLIELNQIDKRVEEELLLFVENSTYNAIKYAIVINKLLNSLNDRYIPYFDKLDLARDGHHYDWLTASKFVDSIIDRLSISSS